MYVSKSRTLVQTRIIKSKTALCKLRDVVLTCNLSWDSMLTDCIHNTKQTDPSRAIVECYNLR